MKTQRFVSELLGEMALSLPRQISSSLSGQCARLQQNFGISTTPPASGLFKKFRKAMSERQKPAVSVLSLHGVIMSGRPPPAFGGGQRRLNVEIMRRHIDRAFDGPDRLEAVLLTVNSPGGVAGAVGVPHGVHQAQGGGIRRPGHLLRGGHGRVRRILAGLRGRPDIRHQVPRGGGNY